MTTITTTELRRSTPHRTRRYVIAALATAALLAPTALVVSRINDNDAQLDAAPKTNAVLDSSPAVNQLSVNATPATSPGRLVINEASWEACAMGHADVCPFAHTWAPVGLENLDVITDACTRGFADACVVAAKVR